MFVLQLNGKVPGINLHDKGRKNYQSPNVKMKIEDCKRSQIDNIKKWRNGEVNAITASIGGLGTISYEIRFLFLGNNSIQNIMDWYNSSNNTNIYLNLSKLFSLWSKAGRNSLNFSYFWGLQNAEKISKKYYFNK